MNTLIVGGARPNFIKIAALYHEFAKRPAINVSVIHTGQHFDSNMSQVFFDELELPEPDANLNVSGGTHTSQIARIMVELEKVLERFAPDIMIVVGDVNSTLAASLVAAKCGLPLAHVEAGLRSGDRGMPEEINRIVVDHLADFLFVTEQAGMNNLKREGIADGKVFFVGNVMIDTLIKNSSKIEQSDVLSRLNLSRREYAVVTLHRPSNSDDAEVLKGIVSALTTIGRETKVVFPVHPRTKKRMDEFGTLDEAKRENGFLLTDSGGIQEETTFLSVPCITMRENTERPVTLDHGTNRLVGKNSKSIIEAYRDATGKIHKPGRPPLWDGHSASRIADILEEKLK